MNLCGCVIGIGIVLLRGAMRSSKSGGCDVWVHVWIGVSAPRARSSLGPPFPLPPLFRSLRLLLRPSLFVSATATFPVLGTGLAPPLASHRVPSVRLCFPCPAYGSRARSALSLPPPLPRRPGPMPLATLGSATRGHCAFPPDPVVFPRPLALAPTLQLPPSPAHLFGPSSSLRCAP